MPVPGSPYTSVPPGISYPATTLTPQGAAMALAQMPGNVTPPGAQMSPSMGDPLSVDPLAGVQQSPGQEEMDLFQRVVLMLMNPQTQQLDPMKVLIFAGMGVSQALEKSGKFSSKPHRSNAELQASGMDDGIPGQTGLPDERQMAAQTAPPAAPGMVGF